jgi:hypothetical protein
MTESFPLFPNLLDPKLASVFDPLCEEVSPNQIIDLQKQIAVHIGNIKDALQQNEFIDLDLAEHIASILVQILKELASYPENKRRLIIGASRYFIQSHDAQADLASVLGFDDDATVLNYVLMEIGRSDLKVEL